MSSRGLIASIFAIGIAAMACTGCSNAPGYPRQGEEVPRPEQVLDFQVLYKSNCAGCHGDNGRNGAALPLNNPAYLAIAGADTLRTSIGKGVSGTLMPPFAKSSGGMLTDQQVESISQGILHNWGRPSQFAGVDLPAYNNGSSGDPSKGQELFAAGCARCHGSDGMGLKGNGKASAANRYSIADADYLALV
jgi:mono/diheme cytochrome c family protein